MAASLSVAVVLTTLQPGTAIVESVSILKGEAITLTSCLSVPSLNFGTTAAVSTASMSLHSQTPSKDLDISKGRFTYRSWSTIRSASLG